MMSSDYISVWQGDLSFEDINYQRHWSVLDSAEQVIASKVRSKNRHNEYVHIHGLLRYQLGLILNHPPERLVINRSQTGKPYLGDYPKLVFNISHSAEHFIIAIATDCQLGIDVECIRPRKNIRGLVSKCFAQVEQDYWNQLSEPEQIKAFYQFWTRKEAFVKATGHGIALGIDRCVINPMNINVFNNIPEDIGVIDDWFIHEIPIKQDYCAALVTDKKIAQIRVFNLQNES